MEPDVLFAGDSAYGHYEVADAVYAGRPARVLYSGEHDAAQSGLALDGRPELLFDYNERFMELIRGKRPQRMLLIGGGACTLPKAVLELWPDAALDIVEPDELLLTLARTYFGFIPGPHTRLHITDGRRFLESVAARYDLVLVDAFLDAAVPASLTDAGAVRVLHHALLPGGVVAMNTIAAGLGRRAAGLQRDAATLRGVFRQVTVFPASGTLSLWIPQNFVVTAQDGAHDLAAWFRYAPVKALAG